MVELSVHYSWSRPHQLTFNRCFTLSVRTDYSLFYIVAKMNDLPPLVKEGNYMYRVFAIRWQED